LLSGIFRDTFINNNYIKDIILVLINDVFAQDTAVEF